MITQSSGACDSRSGPSIERPSRCGSIQESVATVRAVETLFDDAIAAAEYGLKYAGPALLERKSAPVDGVVSPSNGIAIVQNGFHAALV